MSRCGWNRSCAPRKKRPDADGGFIGIGVNDTSVGTQIGGSAAGTGNVISGLAHGIILTGDALGTVIQGNKIGTAANGIAPISNSGQAITINGIGSTSGNLIGGSNPGEGNTIDYNCGQGITFGGTATDWPIIGNSIAFNGGLGISFQPTLGPTPNDPGDGDTGPNNLQNCPVIASAPVSGGSTTISGTLNSTANTAFRVEFFAGAECDASGFGEGQTFIGFDTMTTDNNGDASFGPLTFALPPGQTAISATATDPTGNTSEFSQCVDNVGRIFAGSFEFICPGELDNTVTLRPCGRGVESVVFSEVHRESQGFASPGTRNGASADGRVRELTFWRNRTSVGPGKPKSGTRCATRILLKSSRSRNIAGGYRELGSVFDRGFE